MKNKLYCIFIIVVIIAINLFSVPVYANQYREMTDLNNFDSAKYPGYKEKLQALKAEHPNWNFIIFYTGLKWSDVVYNETTVAHGRSLIQNKVGEWVCPECGTTPKEGSNWYCASEKTVSYYLDPRNFLSTDNVFQFENLSYVDGLYTEDGVEEILKGTFMYNKSMSEYYGNEAYPNKKFATLLMEVGKDLGVSPYHLASRIRQEVVISGGEPSGSASGKYSELEGYFNFFNIRATGDNPVRNGLEYARDKGWDSPDKSIRAGTETISQNYIAKNQNTLYLEKFDVDSSFNSLYYHQYQQNVQAPSAEGKRIYNKVYSSILNNNFNFVIPVYENMPTEVSEIPREDRQLPDRNTIINSEIVRVIANGGLKLRAAPTTNSGTITTISTNALVARLEKNVANSDGYDWDKIQLTDGRIGYVASKYLQAIESNNSNNATQPSGESISVDEDSKTITCLPELSVQSLKEYFAEKNVSVKNNEGAEVQDDLGTGMKATIENDTYTIIKLGDINGDGKIKASDYVLIKNHIMDTENNKFDDIKTKAADMNKDGKIKASDYVLIKNYIMNR